VTIASTLSVTASSSAMPPCSRPDSKLVGGQTDHLQFARLVAQALLADDPSTDFNARNQDLLLASAPAPYGDSARLAQDLTAFTPTRPALDSMRTNRTTVTVELTGVQVSVWAANRLAGIGVSPGVYGIDVTGGQTVTTKGGSSTTVPVYLGDHGGVSAGDPVLHLGRVLPAHLQDALGSNDLDRPPGPVGRARHGSHAAGDGRRRDCRRGRRPTTHQPVRVAGLRAGDR